MKVAVVLLAMVATILPAGKSPADATMTNCHTHGIIWNGSQFGSRAGCDTPSGPIRSIRTWVSCNNQSILYGPSVSSALLVSNKYCPVGKSVTSYGYQVT